MARVVTQFLSNTGFSLAGSPNHPPTHHLTHAGQAHSAIWWFFISYKRVETPKYNSAWGKCKLTMCMRIWVCVDLMRARCFRGGESYCFCSLWTLIYTTVKTCGGIFRFSVLDSPETRRFHSQRAHKHIQYVSFCHGIAAPLVLASVHRMRKKGSLLHESFWEPFQSETGPTLQFDRWGHCRSCKISGK